MLLMVLAGAVALAGGERLIETPSRWLEEPTATARAAAFPEAAALVHIDGSAAIYCRVSDTGFLQDCRPQRESPSGYGFGAAALSLSTGYRMTPPAITDGGTAYVVVPVRFDRPTRALHDRLAADGPIIQSPTWARAPSFAEVAAAYPAGANGVDGSASILCRFGASGVLSRCAVTRESPPGLGFGEAAKSLASKFEVSIDPSWSMADQRYGVEVPVRLTSGDKPQMRDHLISRPEWITTFSPTAASTFFPPAAADKGLTTGRGVAECKVDTQGRLDGCRSVAAEPAGLGFAESAVAAASKMRMSPWTLDGGPVDGAKVRIPVRFTFQETKPEPATVAFLRQPSGVEIMSVFPVRALVEHVPGHVDLRCRVLGDGAIDDCKVADEAPAGWDFGLAAERLAPKFKVAMRAPGHPEPGALITVPVSLETMSH